MVNYKNFNDYEIMYLVGENDEFANNILLNKYRPVIVKAASKYYSEASRYGLEMDDLIQEGYIGLYDAMKNYNSNMNVLFYTYAMISIFSKIMNCVKMRKAQKHACLNQSISLSQPISNLSEDMILLDVLEDTHTLSPACYVEEMELEENLKSFILSLDDLHSSVFELKLNGFKNGDIGTLLDISPKNVTNILYKLRKKLQLYLVHH